MYGKSSVNYDDYMRKLLFNRQIGIQLTLFIYMLNTTNTIITLLIQIKMTHLTQ